MSKNNKDKRNHPVLAIYPNFRGFAYAVMNDALTLCEAQIITVRPLCNDRCLKSVKDIIEYFEPVVVVLENHEHPSSHKAKRIKNLIDDIVGYAKENEIPTHAYSRTDIRFAFSNFDAHTKHEIATVISQNIPQLKRKLMPPRKAYESERYTAVLFDAVSLGITYFYLSE